VTTSLPSPRRLGLSTADAESRRLQYGSNRIESGNDETLLHEILESLREPLVLLLLGVGVLYVVFGEYRDAAIIFGVIITVAATEAKRSRHSQISLRRLYSSGVTVPSPSGPPIRSSPATLSNCARVRAYPRT